jgi:hypothetical protein
MTIAKTIITALILAGSLAVLPGGARATTSSVFWAPSTPSLQPFGVLHLTYDTYAGTAAAYPIDTGLEIGVLPYQSIGMEVGFDLLYPTFSAGEPLEVPILLNARLGGPEGALFRGAPAWCVGIYSVGFEEDVTDYNVVHAVLGRTFPVGTLSAGAYLGLNEDLFRSSDGDEASAGFLAGWTAPALDVPLIDRIVFAWDLQTGENAFGATGGGAAFYFTPAVCVLMGPVFFFDEDLQPGGSGTMWSMQLDADLSLIGQ